MTKTEKKEVTKFIITSSSYKIGEATSSYKVVGKERTLVFTTSKIGGYLITKVQLWKDEGGGSRFVKTYFGSDPLTDSFEKEVFKTIAPSRASKSKWIAQHDKAEDLIDELAKEALQYDANQKRLVEESVSN